MPVTPLASPGSPKNRASISPSSTPTPGSTEDHPPKPTCSATSKSRRHQSIRWSSPSNDKVSSDDSRDSQGASSSWLLPKTCRSYADPNSNRQNLCVTPLGRGLAAIHPDEFDPQPFATIGADVLVHVDGNGGYFGAGPPHSIHAPPLSPRSWSPWRRGLAASGSVRSGRGLRGRPTRPGRRRRRRWRRCGRSRSWPAGR